MRKYLKHALFSSDQKRQIKIYYSPELSEYTVRLYESGKVYPAQDYFTDSEDDAYGTAKHMILGVISGSNKNPAPHIGIKKPVCKSPPTKKLVKRRKKNTETGYFPNPEVHHRMTKKKPTMKIIRPEFHVRTKKDHMIVQSFSSMIEAERFAHKFADANDCIVSITD